jgi:DNA-binding transcriptional LysR family regulator
MDRIKTLATFKAVAESGGFSRAATSLDLSCAQVTRAVQDLEKELGVQLLKRTTRRVTLTAAGENVLGRAAPLLESYAELAAIGKASATSVSGALRVAAPASYGRWLMNRAVANFISSHPGVRVDLRLQDGPLDLCQSNDDLAICLSRDLRPSLIARQLVCSEVALYAAPTYVLRRGAPVDIAHLAEHACLGADIGQASGWRLRRAGSAEFLAVNVRKALDTTNAELIVDATEQGMGIALLPEVVAEASVRARRLERVLPHWQAAPLVLHLAYRSRINQPLLIRTFMDHLIRALPRREPPMLVGPQPPAVLVRETRLRPVLAA